MVARSCIRGSGSRCGQPSGSRSSPQPFAFVGVSGSTELPIGRSPRAASELGQHVVVGWDRLNHWIRVHRALAAIAILPLMYLLVLVAHRLSADQSFDPWFALKATAACFPVVLLGMWLDRRRERRMSRRP